MFKTREEELVLDYREAIMECRCQCGWTGKRQSAPARRLFAGSVCRDWLEIGRGYEDKKGGVMSKRGEDWKAFAGQVNDHIENYTVPQYGDKGEDQASEYGSAEHVLQAKRYLARYGKNSRPGQEVLDLIKTAHYCQMAAMELTKELEASNVTR